MGLIGRILGTEDSINKGIDVLKDGLDKLVYTDEEKAEDTMKMKQKSGELLISWLQASQGQNVTRRLIAIVITFTWLILYLSATAIDLAVIWINDVDVNDMLTESSAVISDRAYEMNGAVMLILGFYFALPHVGKFAGKAIDRFGGK